MIEQFYIDIFEEELKKHKNLMKYKDDLEAADASFQKNVDAIFESKKFNTPDDEYKPYEKDIDLYFEAAAKLVDPAGKPIKPNNEYFYNIPAFKRGIDFFLGLSYTRILFSIMNDRLRKVQGELPADLKNLDAFGEETLLTTMHENDFFKLQKPNLAPSDIDASYYDNSKNAIANIIVALLTNETPHNTEIISKYREQNSVEKQQKFIDGLSDAVYSTIQKDETDKKNIKAMIESFTADPTNKIAIKQALDTTASQAGMSIDDRDLIIKRFVELYPKSKGFENVKLADTGQKIALKDAWVEIKKAQMDEKIASTLEQVLNPQKSGGNNLGKKIDDLIADAYLDKFNVRLKREFSTVPGKPTKEDIKNDYVQSYLDLYHEYSKDEIMCMYEKFYLDAAKPEEQNDIKPTAEKKEVKASVKPTQLITKGQRDRLMSVKYVIGYIMAWAFRITLESMQQQVINKGGVNEDFYDEGIVSGITSVIGKRIDALASPTFISMPISMQQAASLNNIKLMLKKIVELGPAISIMPQKLNSDVFDEQTLKNSKIDFKKVSYDVYENLKRINHDTIIKLFDKASPKSKATLAGEKFGKAIVGVGERVGGIVNTLKK